MIKRYEDPRHAENWSEEKKVARWQETEMAVIRARVLLGRIEPSISNKISDCLKRPVDLVEWKKLEKELNHDLQAFINERKELLPDDLKRHFHSKMTSYDTEEPAFVRTLSESVEIVTDQVIELDEALAVLAKKHRFTLMSGRTHGQEAEIQSFGKRCLTWLVQLRLGMERLDMTGDDLKYSKLSGTIGNYTGVDPELEKKALGLLKLEPFIGATQIVPREVYLPTAQALHQITMTIGKIAMDIRLMARSGLPLVHEPFGKKQTGSSAMPHKKNTIMTENIEGMCRMATANLSAIMANISTWEERDISQSSVERVSWTDLFHVTSRAITVMTKVINGLVVYDNNMLKEITNTNGCYAAARAASFLQECGIKFGINSETAYRMVQLAAFNIKEYAGLPSIAENPASSLEEAESKFLALDGQREFKEDLHLRTVLSNGKLLSSRTLGVTTEEVAKWNRILLDIFSEFGPRVEWQDIFNPAKYIENEDYLFDNIR